MAWIETVAPEQAEGLLAGIYKAAVKRAGQVFNILRLQSLNPPVLRAGIGLYREAMHGESPLSRAQREMIATVVSRANDCHY
jgi:alkylhydroperoxidase family enzyme